MSRLRGERAGSNSRYVKDFYHSDYIDVLLGDKAPILRVVDEATRYQAPRWLDLVNFPAVWNSLRLRYIDVNLCPPNIIVHEAANVFLAQEFQHSAENLPVVTRCVPVEVANSTSIFERYLGTVRGAYKHNALLHWPSLCLSIADGKKSNQCLFRPRWYCPTSYVCAAITRLGLACDPPTESTVAGAKALKCATEHRTEYFSSRQYRSECAWHAQVAFRVGGSSLASQCR